MAAETMSKSLKGMPWLWAAVLALCLLTDFAAAAQQSGRGLLQTVRATAPAPAPATSSTISSAIAAGNVQQAAQAIGSAAASGQSASITSALGSSITAGNAERTAAAVSTALGSTNAQQNTVVAQSAASAVSQSAKTSTSSSVGAAGAGISALLGIGQKAIVTAGLASAILAGSAVPAVLSTNQAVFAGNLDSFETCGLSPANPYASAVALFLPGGSLENETAAAAGVSAAFTDGLCEVVDAVVLTLSDELGMNGCPALQPILIDALELAQDTVNGTDISAFAVGVAQSKSVSNCTLSSYNVASDVTSNTAALQGAIESASSNLNTTQAATLLVNNLATSQEAALQTALGVAISIARAGCNTSVQALLSSAQAVAQSGAQLSAFNAMLASSSLIDSCLQPTADVSQQAPVAVISPSLVSAL